MEKTSVGKLCQRNERGLHDAPGAARPRFSLHLRASAYICLHLYCPLSTAHCSLFLASAGSLLMRRVMSEGRDFSTIIYRPSSDVPLSPAGDCGV